MTPEAQRIAIAEHMGYKGCTDSNCDYRKCQHLHKDGKVFFPESYSVSRYPDYLNDRNAMHEVVETIPPKHEYYASELALLLGCNEEGELNVWDLWQIAHASTAQCAEAFLRTIGKWTE